MEQLNRLIFTNNTYLYLLTCIFLPILFFYKAKLLPQKNYNDDFLSKSTTDCLKGLCVLVVVLHHVSLLMPTTTLYCFGYLAVTIFLFLSGYGLTVSYLNKNDYLDNFFSRRLTRIYIPFVVLNVIGIGLTSLNTKLSATDMIFYFLGIKLIDGTLWFIQTIIIFYIMFYIAFKFMSRNIAAHFLVLVSFIYLIVCYKIGLGIWVYNTAFCFPLGVYIALYYKKFVKLIKNNYILAFLLSGTCFAITFIFGNFIYSDFQTIFSLISSVCLVFFVLVFLLKVQIASKLLRVIGNISCEIYLIHMKVLVVYFSMVKLSGSYSIYIYLSLLILLAYLLNKSLGKVYKIFGKIQ